MSALGRMIVAATTPVLRVTIWRRWLADDQAVLQAMPTGEWRWRHDWELEQEAGRTFKRTLAALHRLHRDGLVEQARNSALWRLRLPDAAEPTPGEGDE